MQIARTTLLAIVGAGACRFTNTTDPPEPPAIRIVIEPDTVHARISAQQRVQFVLLVRIFNDGPGQLFVAPCGHELQRAAPNGAWTRVFTPPCPRDPIPPFVVDVGGTFGYQIRIIAPVDSGPWRTGEIRGHYRTISYISAEFRAAGAWGRPVSMDKRMSPVFPVIGEVP